MKRALCLTLALALAGAVAPALAHDHGEAKKTSAVKAEILQQIEDAERKLIGLAEATPAEKFAWSPGDKIRSTGQVFTHVAGGNYFLLTLLGHKAPEGINLREIDKDAGDKAKVLDLLKKSFAHARSVIEATPDADFDKAAKLFNKQGTVREGFLLIATHAHEHLGQSIAYARMNGITPPWSA